MRWASRSPASPTRKHVLDPLSPGKLSNVGFRSKPGPGSFRVKPDSTAAAGKTEAETGDRRRQTAGCPPIPLGSWRRRNAHFARLPCLPLGVPEGSPGETSVALGMGLCPSQERFLLPPCCYRSTRAGAGAFCAQPSKSPGSCSEPLNHGQMLPWMFAAKASINRLRHRRPFWDVTKRLRTRAASILIAVIARGLKGECSCLTRVARSF